MKYIKWLHVQAIATFASIGHSQIVKKNKQNLVILCGIARGVPVLVLLMFRPTFVYHTSVILRCARMTWPIKRMICHTNVIMRCACIVAVIGMEIEIAESCSILVYCILFVQMLLEKAENISSFSPFLSMGQILE